VSRIGILVSVVTLAACGSTVAVVVKRRWDPSMGDGTMPPEVECIRVARDPAIDYAIGLMKRAFHEPQGSPERDDLMSEAMAVLEHIVTD
jgi:hypothetical protein